MNLRACALPLAAGALLRLGLWALALARTGTRVITSGDTASYLEPGLNLLRQGRFTTAGLPEIDRTPGYPLFLAATSGAGPAVAALAQIALGLLVIVLAARLAEAVFARRAVTVAAAWLMAFEPVAVIYSVRLLSETLFLVFFLIFLERLVVFLRRRDRRVLAVSGLALTAAIYVRPIGYFLPYLLIVYFFVIFRHERARLVETVAVLLVTTLPWLALWQMRNRIETGFGGFSSIATRNLYFYTAAGVQAAREGRTLSDEQRGMGYFSADRVDVRLLSAQRAAAQKIIAADPGIFLRQQMAGTLAVALTPCAAEMLKLLGPMTRRNGWSARDRGRRWRAWRICTRGGWCGCPCSRPGFWRCIRLRRTGCGAGAQPRACRRCCWSSSSIFWRCRAACRRWAATGCR